MNECRKLALYSKLRKICRKLEEVKKVSPITSLVLWLEITKDHEEATPYIQPVWGPVYRSARVKILSEDMEEVFKTSSEKEGVELTNLSYKLEDLSKLLLANQDT